MDELLKMDFAETEGHVNHFIKSKDLDYFITQYNELSQNDHEVTLNSEFEGEGGVLTLSLEAKSFKKIQRLIFISVSKLIMFVAIIIISVFLILHFELYKIVLLIFWSGLVGGGMLIGAISKEIRLLNKLNLDLKLYGK